jgi:hypothetical protein
MFPDLAIARSLSCLALTSTVVEALRTTATRDELSRLMAAVTRAMKFCYYALIHHDHLRTSQPDLVDLKDYPPAIAERLFGQHRYRRDPVIRGCIFADGAFLWSDLSRLTIPTASLTMRRRDTHG